MSSDWPFPHQGLTISADPLWQLRRNFQEAPRQPCQSDHTWAAPPIPQDPLPRQTRAPQYVQIARGAAKRESHMSLSGITKPNRSSSQAFRRGVVHRPPSHRSPITPGAAAAASVAKSQVCLEQSAMDCIRFTSSLDFFKSYPLIRASLKESAVNKYSTALFNFQCYMYKHCIENGNLDVIINQYIHYSYSKDPRRSSRKEMNHLISMICILLPEKEKQLGRSKRALNGWKKLNDRSAIAAELSKR